MPTSGASCRCQLDPSQYSISDLPVCPTTSYPPTAQMLLSSSAATAFSTLDPVPWLRPKRVHQPDGLQVPVGAGVYVGGGVMLGVAVGVVLVPEMKALLIRPPLVRIEA